MQILPTALDTFSDENRTGQTGAADAQAFSRLFSQYVDAVPAEVTPSLDADQPYMALQDEQSAYDTSSQLLAEAPYTPSQDTTDGAVDAGPRLTGQEVHEVAENLRKQGVDEATVQKVEELAKNPGGATIEDVVRVVAGENPAQLSDVDLQHIESFANQIDPTGELAGPLLEKLRSGRVDEAWGLLKNAINNLDPAQVLSVDRSQLLSLGKALRLSPESQDVLNKNFLGQDSLKATLKGLNELLTPAHLEMNKRSESRDKLVGQLESALTPVVSKARKRIDAEKAAESRTSRDVQYSQTMIRDTTTRNSFVRQSGTEPSAADAKRQNEATNGQTRKVAEASNNAAGSGQQQTSETASVARPLAASAAAAEKADTSRAKPTAEKNAELRTTELTGKTNANVNATGNTIGNAAAQTTQEGKTNSNGQEGARQQANFAPGDPRNQATQNTPGTKNTADNPWDALLKRLDVQTSPGASVVNASVHQASTSLAANQTTARDPGAALSSRVLSQVEQGMLSSLRDGSKRLELKLTPVELGTLSVVLTSRNGEVSALLRPERSETATMLSQQTDQLRSMLEQQGIKVDKVEVQTQLQNNQNGTSWQGMEQHNDSRERQARSEMLERTRRLGRVNGGIGAAGNVVAGRAGLPGGLEQGLHLVA